MKIPFVSSYTAIPAFQMHSPRTTHRLPTHEHTHETTQTVQARGLHTHETIQTVLAFIRFATPPPPKAYALACFHLKHRRYTPLGPQQQF